MTDPAPRKLQDIMVFPYQEFLDKLRDGKYS